MENCIFCKIVAGDIPGSPVCQNRCHYVEFPS